MILLCLAVRSFLNATLHASTSQQRGCSPTSSAPSWLGCPYRNFPLFYRNLPQNTKSFRKTNGCSLEYPESSPIRRLERRTEDYLSPILETFLFFITERRFGGVEAPEGLENVPDIHTKIFRKIKKCFWRNMLDKDQKFPQNTKTFSKINESGFRKIDESRAANQRLSGGSRGLILVSLTSRS